MPDRQDITDKKRTPGKKAVLLLICLILTVGIITAFGPLKNCQFATYDDKVYVKENYFIQSGFSWDIVRWAFSFESVRRGGNWNPIIWLSFMGDYELFGLNPAGYHLVNLFFHLLNTILLFLILCGITEELWKSAFVAALFAVHPLHVESVAWVAERKDVLSTFFFMMTIGTYVFYTEHKTWVRYIGTCFFFALGLMSKSMLVTLPFILILLDYWPLGRLRWFLPAGMTWIQTRQLLLEKIPFLMLSAFFSWIAVISQKEGGFIDVYTPLTIRMGNAIRSYIIYLYKTVWPCNLTFFYPYPTMLPSWHILGSAVILIGISFYVLWKIRKAPYLAIGWFWYLGTLIPVIGIIQIGLQAYADRYTYIPLIGIFLMFSWGISDLLKQLRFRLICAVILLTCLITMTRIQISYWKDIFTLNTHAVQVTENNYVAYTCLGSAYITLGNCTEAIENLDRAININPHYGPAYNDRGVACLRLRDYGRAIDDFDRAIEIDPNYAPAYNDRGVARLRLRNYGQAIDDFDRAIEIDPNYLIAYCNRGGIYSDLGNYGQAIEDFDKAIEIDPSYANAYYYRGATYIKLGNYNQAFKDLKIAAKLGNGSAKNLIKQLRDKLVATDG